MSLRARLSHAWSALTGRGAPPSSAGNYGWTGGPMSADAFGAKRAPTPWKLVEAYKGVVYACANGNATATVRVPLRLYAKKGKGMAAPRCAHVGTTRAGRMRLAALPWVARSMAEGDDIHEVTEHPLLDVLDRPNSEFDRVGLLRYMLLSLDIVGSAYLVPNDGGFGPPRELWPLEPHWVYPVRKTGSALVEKYTYFSRDYMPDELIRFRWVGLRDGYGPGYSPGQASWEYSGLEDKWTSVQDQLLGLQARPGVVVSAKDAGAGAMGPDEAKYLEQSLNRKFGPGGQGRLLVSTTPLDVSPVEYPAIDPGGMALSTYDLQRIANIFCYPIEYLTSDTNLANLQAAHRKHAEQAIEPRCHVLASVLTAYARRFDERLFFAFDSCLAEDEESEAKVFGIKLGNGSLTINEARAEDGLEPVDWGDEPWLPSSLRQPSEERPEPAMPGGPPKPGADEPKPKAKATEAKKEDRDMSKIDTLSDSFEVNTAPLAKVLDGIVDRLAALSEREDGRTFRRPDEPAAVRPPARRGRPPQGAGVLVQDAAEGGPGPDGAAHGGGARELPEPGGLRRPDEPGHEPDDLGLLERGGAGDAGPAGGGDGPGPGGPLAGGEPAPAIEDRDLDPELLPRDQQDDHDAAQ